MHAARCGRWCGRSGRRWNGVVAGYDALIVEGISPKPVYLWIMDGVAEWRDASTLWGKQTKETLEARPRAGM